MTVPTGGSSPDMVTACADRAASRRADDVLQRASRPPRTSSRDGGPEPRWNPLRDAALARSVPGGPTRPSV